MLTEREIITFLAYLDHRYPNSKIQADDMTIKIWLGELHNYTTDDLNAAFAIYKSTNTTGFAPNIDQLLDCMHKVEDMKQMPALEAWGLVSKAIRRSSRHAQEEFDKLPALVQKTVGSASKLYDWSQTDLVMVETSIAKQFQENYKVMAKREREYNRMPASIQHQLGAITSSVLAQLPRWENPNPIVIAKDEERIAPEVIDSHMERLRALIN